MSGWAALAGGASGVMSGWDDNREAIKAQAERDFKLQLEQTRRDNVKSASDQQARDMLDPTSAQGALAKHNADAANATRQAEWAREDKNRESDRQNTLASAQAKAGKGSAALKHLEEERGHWFKKTENPDVTPEQLSDAMQNVRRITNKINSLTGVEYAPPPAPKVMSDKDKAYLIKNPGKKQAMIDTFGQADVDGAFAEYANAQKLKAGAQKAEAAKAAQDRKHSMLGSLTTDTTKSDKRIAAEAKVRGYKERKTSSESATKKEDREALMDQADYIRKAVNSQGKMDYKATKAALKGIKAAIMAEGLSPKEAAEMKRIYNIAMNRINKQGR